MGTFRSNFPTMPESNRGASSPHFAWFHPGSFLGAGRTGFNPFQGTQLNQDGITAVPLRSMVPIDEAADDLDPDVELPKPKKKQKTPKKESELKPKKPSKKKKSKGSGSPSAKRERQNLNIAGYEGSGIPAPVCSCTGTPRVCYRWGAGGWQSSCCTTNISEYPLPMSTTRAHSRVAGRKMSNGAYEKLIHRLAGEGYDLTLPVDLKDHWAKHGTNKFVIIK